MCGNMHPEECARLKIDAMLNEAGWEVVSRDDFSPYAPAVAVKEAILVGNLEADYLLMIYGKAVGVIEAKAPGHSLNARVAAQAERYTRKLPEWYKAYADPLPFVYLSDGYKILFRDQRSGEADYTPLTIMHTPDALCALVNETSGGYFPPLPAHGLRACQREALTNFDNAVLGGDLRTLIILATGAGKTFTACMAAYRMLAAKRAGRVLFLVDRRNLGEQAEAAFGTFRLTETKEAFTTIYSVERATSSDIPKSDVVISTIQRLYSCLTGEEMEKEPDDEDENLERDESGPAVQVKNARIPRDYFDLIFVDECHRSIYGRWQEVLTYFDSAHIVGLTATPSDETRNFFNNQIACEYTFEQSVADGVNVDYRTYRIKTLATELGGVIGKGENVTQLSNRTGIATPQTIDEPVVYTPAQLDRAIEYDAQIKLVLETFRDAVYRNLYPDRAQEGVPPPFEYLPKTLIFAKSVRHASRIVSIAKEVFPGEHENFIRQITCDAGNPQLLIRDFNNDVHFRIAVTVTLVATGTDVPSLEVLLFMRDVASEQLFVQMRGRGVRTISDEKLRAVTPNADSKDEFFLVDAVGVTEHAMQQTVRPEEPGDPVVTFPNLLEKISHGFLPDEFLRLLASRLSRITKKSTPAQNTRFAELSGGVHMKSLAETIYCAVAAGLPPFTPGGPNPQREALVRALAANPKARDYLLVLHAGFRTIIGPGPDGLIFNGFPKEEAVKITSEFENYLQSHRETNRILRIICDLQGVAATYADLKTLTDELRGANNHFQTRYLWSAYETLFAAEGKVTKLTIQNKDVKTNLIALVRFALHLRTTLESPTVSVPKAYALWRGQKQRTITDEQNKFLLQLLSCIAENGFYDEQLLRTTARIQNLSQVIRQGKQLFKDEFNSTLESLSRFILACAS